LGEAENTEAANKFLGMSLLRCEEDQRVWYTGFNIKSYYMGKIFSFRYLIKIRTKDNKKCHKNIYESINILLHNTLIQYPYIRSWRSNANFVS
ncbi:hypothetical protein L9F63_000324, partial [Diploptera punctata]